MKKILLVLLVFFINSTWSFAFQMPRWGYFPLNVYIEPHEKKIIVEKAFSTWQSETGVAKFRYVPSEKQYPNIIVKFSQNNPNSSKPDSNLENAIGVTYVYTPLGFFAKANVIIYLTEPGSNELLSDTQLYAVALHEIGHALGLLSHSSSKDDIMYPYEHGQTELSQNDLKRFNYIYSQ